jgi:3-oxoacyl-[acyl-carrier protein] reductase
MRHDRPLQGRTALVTGAASGIGAATVRQLGYAGAKVYCLDVDREGVETVASSLMADGHAAVGKVVDVADVEAMESIANEAVSDTGSLDIAVANAGIEGPGTAISTLPDQWERVLRTNLTGVWITVRSVLPHMVRQSAGSIVATASLAGVVGVPNIAAYAASKGGVIALVRQVAADYSGSGIRINAVCPGTIPTPLVQRSYEAAGGVGVGDTTEERLASAAARYPLGRIGTADEVASAICFLAGDTSGWITGVALPVDGGASAV